MHADKFSSGGHNSQNSPRQTMTILAGTTYRADER